MIKSKQINLFGKEFLIYENGDLINLKTNKKLKAFDNGVGYLRVGIYVGDKKHKAIYIHRLLAQTFIPNPKNKIEVNHKDGNTKNNDLSNLEWVTKSENQLHAYKLGLNKPSPSIGEKNGNAVLNDEMVTKIRIMFKNGTRQYEIAKQFNVSKYLISNVVLNKTWKHIKI
jgi:hypothetical protein